MIKQANHWLASQKTHTIMMIKFDQDGTRIQDLPIRSRAPYPLGHVPASKRLGNNILTL